MAPGGEYPERFEREFDILDEDLGSGELGRVLEVRQRVGGGAGLPRTFNLSSTIRASTRVAGALTNTVPASLQTLWGVGTNGCDGP